MRGVFRRKPACTRKPAPKCRCSLKCRPRSPCTISENRAGGTEFPAGCAEACVPCACLMCPYSRYAPSPLWRAYPRCRFFFLCLLFLSSFSKSKGVIPVEGSFRARVCVCPYVSFGMQSNRCEISRQEILRRSTRRSGQKTGGCLCSVAVSSETDERRRGGRWVVV